MFFIIGFGKQTVKKYGMTPEGRCTHCGKVGPRILTRVTSWVTLFFIPIVPYNVKYFLICPICNDVRAVERDELEAIIRDLQPMDSADGWDVTQPGEPGDGQAGWPSSGGEAVNHIPDIASTGRYTGKNPTQKAYLEKLEAHEKALEARQTKEKYGEETSEPQAGLGTDGLEARIRDLEAWEKALDTRERAADKKERYQG